MTYRLVIKPAAEKEIAHLAKPVRLRVAERLAQLETDPRLPGAMRLVGTKNAYRVRVGDWRVVYEIDDKAEIVYVTIVAHRREVYRGL